jgi:hypothetical protein
MSDSDKYRTVARTLRAEAEDAGRRKKHDQMVALAARFEQIADEADEQGAICGRLNATAAKYLVEC